MFTLKRAVAAMLIVPVATAIPKPSVGHQCLRAPEIEKAEEGKLLSPQ